MESNEAILLRLDQELKEEIRKASAEQRMSMTTFIIQAIMKELKRLDKE